MLDLFTIYYNSYLYFNVVMEKLSITFRYFNVEGLTKIFYESVKHQSESGNLKRMEKKHEYAEFVLSTMLKENSILKTQNKLV